MNGALPPLTRDLAIARGLVDPAHLALPEKAVQFGTGAFLRGFVDFFLDAANRAGTFGGRVVAIGSTQSGRDATLGAQHGLYTLVAQGLEDGALSEDTRVIASVSRALSAKTEWTAVLACARSADLELVFSNTTEVGIVFDESDGPELAPPRSFPGKLTRFLYERAVAFDYATSKGVAVVPCELIEDNGRKLREIVGEHAARWALGSRFIAWLDESVSFCNTLVDRIVPGAPTGVESERLRNALGYDDGMLTTCETYRLFAIERPALASAEARLALFAHADAGVLVVDDVAPYRERKVRLLNGTHTAIVATALLADCETVREAVEHPLVGAFARHVLFDEIAPMVTVPGVDAFARAVLDRFANPFVQHTLFDITLQGTMKMRVRLVPVFERYAETRGEAPPALAFAFAAFLLFMRGDLHRARRAAGRAVPSDELGAAIAAAWSGLTIEDAGALVDRIARDVTLWGVDLSTIPGFTSAVACALVAMMRDGVPAALDALVVEPSASHNTDRPWPMHSQRSTSS